jgi:putative FmdB family regulatory protein
MPIYAYRCEACGFSKDALQKISDAPLTDCPSCGKPEFKKQLTAAGFQLKGSGWYVTDFRGGAGASGASGAAGGVGAADAPATAAPVSAGNSDTAAPSASSSSSTSGTSTAG